MPRLLVWSRACALIVAGGCTVGGGAPAGGPPEVPPDAARFDGQVDVVEADAAAPPVDGGVLARTWPRTADDLRAAMGGRGLWTSAWQLDEPSGRAADDLGASALDAAGTVAFGRPGAWSDDRAIAFDSPDDRLAAVAPPFELIRTRSLAALFSLRLADAGAGAGGTAIAGQRDATSGAILLAVDPSTGHLSAELGDGTSAALVTLPIDHRDGRYHDVLVVVDRAAQTLRVQSDLGRSPAASIAAVGDVTPAAPFTLGATHGAGAASASLAYAAIATGDIGALASAADDALRSLRLATERPPPPIRPPAGLPWVPPWPIVRDQRGRYVLDVDPRTLRVDTAADLWVSPAGSDAAAGTVERPLRSLHAALAALTAPTTIHLAPGDYDADAGWYGVSPRFDVNVIAEGGRARVTAADVDLVWAASATSGVFTATAPSAPYAVIDGAAVDVDPWLTRVGSVAEVEATAGTWASAGAAVTVHTRTGLPPVKLSVMPAATLNAVVDDPARTVYLEGLDLEGGYKALHVNRAHRVIVVDSAFRYGAGEGLSVLATDEVLAFHAVAEANAWDGLAYSTTAHVLEVDCVGRDNGRDGSNIDNGSTVHSGGTVVRLGGDYRGNGGPNVADVQGARSWNLGTVTGGSTATSTTQRVNFYIDGVMWLREATARDQPADATIDLVTGQGAHLHAHDTDRASVGGTGAIDDLAE